MDELPRGVGERVPSGDGEMEDAGGGERLPATVGATVALVEGVPGATLGAGVAPRAVGTKEPFVVGVLPGASVAFDDGVAGKVGVLPGASVAIGDGVDVALGVLPGASVAFDDGGVGAVGVLPGASVAVDGGGVGAFGVLLGASVSLDDGVLGAVGVLGAPPGASVELPGSPSNPPIPVPVTFNFTKFSSANTSSGIVPVRPAFSCSSRIFNRCNKPNSVGMVPLKKFDPNKISVNVVINPISVGKVPSIKLVSRLKISIKTNHE